MVEVDTYTAMIAYCPRMANVVHHDEVVHYAIMNFVSPILWWRKGFRYYFVVAIEMRLLVVIAIALLHTLAVPVQFDFGMRLSAAYRNQHLNLSSGNDLLCAVTLLTDHACGDFSVHSIAE